MCQCDPTIKSPWCGRATCVSPASLDSRVQPDEDIGWDTGLPADAGRVGSKPMQLDPEHFSSEASRRICSPHGVLWCGQCFPVSEPSQKLEEGPPLSNVTMVLSGPLKNDLDELRAAKTKINELIMRLRVKGLEVTPSLIGTDKLVRIEVTRTEQLM